MSSAFEEDQVDHPADPSLSTSTFYFHRQTPRSVKDPVHDYIQLHPEVCEFMDTKQFQRLRYIKQLGTSYYVWPGASHNRFEHCLGVSHLARLMAEHLQKSQPELKITNRDVLCVQIAGLCHDLGHGPWSHVWDSLFIPKALKGKKWKHEDASEMMFDDLIKKNEIQISKQDADFIKALIAGEPNRPGNAPEKLFLFDIVANKRNGIDVDKFDYIARDCHAIGEKGNLSLTRLIHSARVIDNQICYDIKDANQLYELCYTRFSLHKRIYNHKTAKAIEYMVIDALLAAEPYEKIAEQVEKPEKYVFLTDEIMAKIESSTAPELARSRAIFERIHTRDLYKCVDYKVFGWEYRDLCREEITPERIAEAAKDLYTSNKQTLRFSANDVIVDMSYMHYGMQERNPMDFINFYSKNNPDQCSIPEPGDISLLMPAVFGEVLLRVYTKDVRYFGIVQAAYRQVLQTMPDPFATNVATLVPTPPVTEGPSTPRAHSRTLSFGAAPLPDPMTRSPSPKLGATPSGLSRTNNKFMTVPPDHSPSQTRISKSKRARDFVGEDSGASPVKKKRA